MCLAEFCFSFDKNILGCLHKRLDSVMESTVFDLVKKVTVKKYLFIVKECNLHVCCES